MELEALTSIDHPRPSRSSISPTALEEAVVTIGQEELVPAFSLRSALAFSKVGSFFSPKTTCTSGSEESRNAGSGSPGVAGILRRRRGWRLPLFLLCIHSLLCAGLGFLLTLRLLKTSRRAESVFVYHELQPALSRLRDLGFFPKAILDVGASVGRFVRGAHAEFPDATIYGVDGTDRLDPDARALLFQFRTAVLLRQRGLRGRRATRGQLDRLVTLVRVTVNFS